MPTDAYHRFISSMTMTLDKWRDGEGYDLAAIGEMTPEERQSVATILRGRTDWRDVEALAAIGDEASTESIVRSAQTGGPEARMEALSQLHDHGKITDEHLEEQLLNELKGVEPYGGMTKCFFLLDRVNTARIRRRLLWCIIHRPDVAVNLAGKLYQLSGRTDEEFDWSQRPLFLRCGDGEPDRDAAIAQLATLCDLKVADAA